MTIYDLKPKFQALLRPIVDNLAKNNITPNQVTWAALVLSVVAGGLIGYTHGASWTLLLIPVVMFVRMAMNAIDGMLAKEHDMKSDGGAILNEMSDVIADAALYLPLGFVSGISVVWIVVFVVVAIFTEMSGILAQVISGERRYDGPMGKSDRAFVFGFICLVLGVGVEAGLWSTALLVISSLLGSLTVINRAKKALV